MRKIKRYGIIVVLSVSIVVFFYSLLLFAQQNKSECLSRINFRDPNVSRDASLLDGYYFCRAGANDNIGECHGSSECEKHFNQFVGFWGRLFMEKRFDRNILRVCKNNEAGGFNLEECEVMVKAVSEDDQNVCERYNKKGNQIGYNQCKAMLSGNIILCQNDEDCIDKVLFLKAIRDRNPRECSRIKNYPKREMCRGYVSMDEKICEDNKEFIQFYQKHCR